MNFGIFSEHPLPRPWSEDSEYRLLQDSLDQIELRTSREDIGGSLELFEKLDTMSHSVYAHQNEDIVRLTPRQLERKMAAKEAAKAAMGGGA